MSGPLDLSEDLTAVADGLEPITIERAGSTAVQNVAHALRRLVTTREAAASGGRCLRSDVKWHLPENEVVEPPRLGDQIVDGAGNRWTILEIERATIDSRYVCRTRNLRIAAGLDTFVSVQRLTLVETVEGNRDPQWIDLYIGLAARIQLEREEVQTRDSRRDFVKHYRITVAEQVVLEDATSCHSGELRTTNPRFRVLDVDGNTYDITGLENAQRIDELPVIVAVK